MVTKGIFGVTFFRVMLWVQWFIAGENASRNDNRSNHKHSRRQLLLSAIAMALYSLTHSAAAVPVSATLNYSCTYPLIGTQPLSAVINSDMPASIAAGDSTGAFDIDVVATAKGNTWTGLNLVGAISVEGSVAASANISGVNLSLDINVPVVIPEQTVPAVDGDFDITASGQTPPLTFTESNIGETTISVGALDMELLARKADGTTVFFPNSDPDTGIFPVPCTLDAGQDSTLHVFNITAPIPDPLPEISVAPAATISFGDTQIGTTEELAVIVSNIGTADLFVNNVSIDGTDAAAFFQNNDCSTVAATQTCTITVSFSPSGEKNHSAALTIDSNDPDNASVIIALTGQGVLAPEANIGLSQNNLNFSEVQVGVTEQIELTISNTGTAELLINMITLSGTDASEFFQVNDCTIISINGSCTVTVSLTPSGEGVRSAVLTITSNDPDSASVQVPLMGEGVLAPQPEMLVAPTALDFGEVEAGLSADLIVTVTNSGSANLNISAVFIDGTDASEFLQTHNCSAVVPAANCTITVTFLPSGNGSRSASLTLQSDDPSSPTFNVALNGQAIFIPEPELTLTPLALNLGTVQIGNSANSLATITNTGTGDLSITSIILSGIPPDVDATEFSQSHDCTLVAVSASCSISVTLTPTGEGNKSAIVTITSDDPTNPTIQLTLSGEGTSQPLPNISVSQSTLIFTDTLIGNSTDIVMLVGNLGDAPLTISSIAISGVNAADYSHSHNCSTLAVFTSCDLTVTFSPSTNTNHEATLSIVSDDPDTPSLEVPLSGLGTLAPQPEISASTSAISFGTVLLNDTAAENVIIENTGALPLAVSLSLSGTDSASFFQMSDGNCSAMDPGASCTVTVSFSPATVGAHSAVLNLASNDPSNPNVQIVLDGSGEEEQIPDISVTPLTLVFGDVPLGDSSNLTTTVSNLGSGDLTISGVSVTGTDAADFSTNHSCTLITVGNTCSISVTLSPSALGARAATLVISSDDPDSAAINVPLSGTGTPAPEPNISVDNLSLTFADLEVGNSASLDIIAVNNGDADLIISDIPLSGTDAADFSHSHTCATLTPAQTCTITVSFIPASAGLKNGTLTLTSNDPDSPTLIIPLAGESVLAPAPNITVSSTALDFVQRQIGSSTELAITITNDGTAALILSSLALSGDTSFTLNHDCSSVAEQSSCTATVTFAPSDTGAHSGTLTLTSNDPDSPTVTVTLTGEGVPIPVPVIVATPAAIDFSGVLIGSTDEIEISVANPGSADLIVSETTLEGADTAAFSVANNCDQAVEPSANCTLTVTYSPTVVGASAATLMVASNDPATPALAIPLNGLGLALPVPGLSVSQNELTFAEVQPGNASSLELIAENTGTTLLSVTTSIDGTHPGSFFPVHLGSCATLTPGDTCTIAVSFLPATPGIKNATLIITSDADPIEISLSGSGAENTGNTDDDNEPQENNANGRDSNNEPIGEEGSKLGSFDLLACLWLVLLLFFRSPPMLFSKYKYFSG